jgi:hypothetical protein
MNEVELENSKNGDKLLVINFTRYNSTLISSETIFAILTSWKLEQMTTK